MFLPAQPMSWTWRWFTSNNQIKRSNKTGGLQSKQIRAQPTVCFLDWDTRNMNGWTCYFTSCTKLWSILCVNHTKDEKSARRLTTKTGPDSKNSFYVVSAWCSKQTLNTSHHRSKKYAQIWKIPFRYNLKDTKNQRLNTNQGIKWSHCDCYLILTESSSHFLAWHTGLNKLACGWGIYSHSSSFTAGVSFDHFSRARTQSWAPRL